MVGKDSMRGLSFLTVLLAWLTLFPDQAAAELRIAAAADLQFALPKLVARFEQEQAGVKVSTTIGSSGELFAQIENGAAFDLFLSADEKYPRRLVEGGKTGAETAFFYSQGRLVLWVPHSSPLDLSLGLKALLQPGVRKVAIANPEHAPYGAAAAAALRHEGLYEPLAGKLVLGANVAQAAQFAQTGAADAGLIAMSLARAPKMVEAGRFVEVPAAAYPPLRQAGVVLLAARQPGLAKKFRELLLSPAAREILGQHGFLLP